MDSYFGEKRFTGGQILQTCVMAGLSILLINGGFTIINNEDIYRKIYEGFQTTATATSATSSSMRWTATLPDGLTLTSLQKNIGSLRNKSDINIGVGYLMVIVGFLIMTYQIYTLFLT